jgi:hypothetical protein
VTIREATPADAAECGRIIFDAFAAITDQHNFARDFASVDRLRLAPQTTLTSMGLYNAPAGAWLPSILY